MESPGTSQNNKTGVREFTNFMSLPTEIRLMIWREAILDANNNRALILRDRMKRSAYRPRNETYDETYAEQTERKSRQERQPVIVGAQLRPSALFVVNRESREVATSVYNMRLPVCAPALRDSSVNKPSSDGARASPFNVGVPQGWVYISLAHDIFVTLDDHDSVGLNLRDVPNEEFWASVRTTAQLTPTQTAGIERILVIHPSDWWFFDYWDNDLQEWQRLETQVDHVAEECADPVFDETFDRAISRDDLYITYSLYGCELLHAILDLPIAELLDQYPRQIRHSAIRNSSQSGPEGGSLGASEETSQ